MNYSTSIFKTFSAFAVVLVFGVHGAFAQNDVSTGNTEFPLAQFEFSNVTSKVSEEGYESTLTVTNSFTIAVPQTDAQELNSLLSESPNLIERAVQEWLFAEKIKLKAGIPGLTRFNRGLAMKIAKSTGIPCLVKVAPGMVYQKSE